MSRIDVVPAEKGKFKVMINMGMDGSFTYNTAGIANAQAKLLQKEAHNKYKQINLIEGE